MNALTALGIVFLLALIAALILAMCAVIALGILHERHPRRADEIVRRWLEWLSRQKEGGEP